MTKQYNKLRQKRKIAVYNAYYDIDLANKARSWSNERILKELGVSIPKGTPTKRKKPSAQTIKQKQKELEHYRYGVLVGLDYKNAFRLKRYAKPKLESSSEYYKQKKVSVKDFNIPANRSKRIDLWIEWSKNENLPPDVSKMARQLNRNTKIEHGKRVLDINDHYGFSVLFYMFVDDRSQESVQRTLKPDEWDSRRVVYMG